MKKKYLVSKLASFSPSKRLRTSIYKRSGYKIGKNVKISRTARIMAMSFEIGNNSRIADGVFIGPLERIKIGEFTEISQNVMIDGDSSIEIGDNCFIGKNYHINVRDTVTIEDNVALGGSYGQIWTHSTWPEEIEGHQLNKIAPVHIGKNVWIGTKSIIHPGVEIGHDSIIGSNSLVTRTIPEGVLAFGNPAEPIKKVDELKKKLSDWEKEDIVLSLVKRFVDAYGGEYQKTENRIILKRGSETAIVSMKKMEPDEKARLDKKTAFFDIERKRCSSKNIKLERDFRRLANYYSARFKSE